MSMVEYTEEAYSIGSGIYSVAKNKVAAVLNKYGEHKYEFEAEEYLIRAPSVCRMFNGNDDEAIITDQLYSDIEVIKYNSAIGRYRSLYVGYVLERSYKGSYTSGAIT